MTRYCFLDLETTGFEPSKDSIIEVSLVVVENDQEVGRLDQVIIPDKSPLTDFIAGLTGINQAEIDDCGVYFTEVCEQVQRHLEGAVIVGHNIDFDINFLQGNGVDLSANERIDTHELARIVLPQEPSYALEVLSQNYSFTHADAHRAMSDVLASKDLFGLLLEKINQLPQAWLEQINGFLNHETQWYARSLFLDALGSAQAPSHSDAKTTPKLTIESPLQTAELAAKLSAQQNVFVRVSNTRAATNLLRSTAEQVAKGGPNKVCLVTPKLSYFEAFPSLPTPEVLFDPTRAPAFVAARGGTLNNETTTFYLKCLYRHFLGYRGLWQFDLFFKERDWWNEVNAQSVENPVFVKAAAEKTLEPVLTCSPAAWAQLHQHPVLSDRVLIIDEGELSAEMWLQAPTQSFSFHRLLHGQDEEVANATQFFITRLVREFIEPAIGKSVGTFPERVLLNFQDRLDRFSDELRALLPPDDQAFWLEWLAPQDEKLTRYLTYHPESGNLTLFAWHPNDWRELKTALHQAPKLITVRHNIDYNERLFFRVFMGEIEGDLVDVRDPEKAPKLVIPPDLVSQASPDFNASCANHIRQVFQKAEGNVAANFSGLEALRTTYDVLRPQMGEDQFLAAEKVMGGDGKLLEKLGQHEDEKTLLLFQKLLNPELERWNWTDLVMQKFPFGAPDPLLQKLETTLKQSGQNWWNAWVMPRLTATLSRKIGQFPQLQTVHWLDPRENAKWGKAVLKDLFN